MKIEVDDVMLDKLTIQNLKNDLGVLTRIIEREAPESEDFRYSNEIIEAIEKVLDYYGDVE